MQLKILENLKKEEIEKIKLEINKPVREKVGSIY